jgi:hypothetical protein
MGAEQTIGYVRAAAPASAGTAAATAAASTAFPWAAVAGTVLSGFTGAGAPAGPSESNPIVQPYATFNVQPVGINFGNTLANLSQPTNTGGLGLRLDRLFENGGANTSTAFFDAPSDSPNYFMWAGIGLAVAGAAYLLLK